MLVNCMSLGDCIQNCLQGQERLSIIHPQVLSAFFALFLGHVLHTLLLPVPMLTRSARSPAK